MSIEEISKKDLLILTGISYGQLYRWKRKGLIPEEWFDKRSSYTGQETYFPKEAILNRIETILSYKNDKSLEEIAEIINNSMNIENISKEDLMKKNILTNNELYLLLDDNFDLLEIIIVKIIDVVGTNNDDYDYDNLRDFLNENTNILQSNKLMMNILTKGNDQIFMLTCEDIIFSNTDFEIKIIEIDKLIEEIKLRLSL